MKKEINLTLLTLILSLNLISAYTRTYGSFNNFSPENFFQTFDTSMILLAIAFLIIFYGLNKTIQKTSLGHNKSTSTIISIILSIFSIYGIVKSNIQIDELLYSIGLNNDLTQGFIIALSIIAIIIILKKSGLKGLFLITGSLLIFAALLDLVYEKGFATGLGGILILIGIFIWKKRTKKNFGSTPKEKRAILEVNVNGTSYNCGYGPKTAKTKITGNAWITIANRGENKLNWIIKSSGGIAISDTRGTLSSNQSKQIKLQKNSIEKTKMVVYGKGLMAWQRCTIIIEGTNSTTPTTPRTDILKDRAKKLKKYAEKQDKPQLYKSYMYFIGYLKNEKYGNNEKEIMDNLNVSQKDIQYAVKKYLQ